MNRKLPDGEARRKIVKELDKTFFVEAGAGSGKTKSLVDRMIALLSAGKCAIRTLAAVTFTRKAAAELRGRFQVELERKVAAESDPAVRKRLSEALQNLEQCYIGTIHSFCARMLRERPIEVGLDPEFTEMEELEDGVFREKCWNEFMVKVRLEQEEIIRELEEVSLAPEDLKDAFEAVSLYPEVRLVGGSRDKPDYPRYRKALEDFLVQARGLVPKEKPEKGYDGLQRVILRCLGRQRNLGFSEPGVLMETIELLSGKPGITWNRWPQRELAEKLSQALEVFKANVADPALKAWREYRQEKVIRFLALAVQFYTKRRKEDNRLNFEDLLMQARKLLLENPEVRRYFSRKFTHVLVDELQDTDPIQAEVLLYLKGLDTKERDWRKLRVEPGSLFLVGDPKQSIFRFRRADIDIYNLVKETIVAGGGEVLRLTTNFRSLAALGKWNNAVFKAVFPAESTPYQAAFAPLVTVRREEEAEPEPSIASEMTGVCKIVLPAVPRNKGEDIAGMDAAVIAEWIRHACGEFRGGQNRAVPIFKPADFLILFRYKKFMDLYARALEERGVPFEITGSDAFAGAWEIQEIVNLARALNDPDNPIYTVAGLRGIFFGVSDEDLVKFQREGGRFNFMTPGLDLLKCKQLGAANVALGLQRMKEWRGWTLRMPPSAALAKIFEESGILNYLVSKEMGSSRVGNLLKLLEILRNEESKGITAFSKAVAFMEELAEVREIEEISLTPGRTDAVRLMNLHKAKGLEARVVFLANPVGIREHPVEKHVVRTAGVVPEGFFAFSRRVGHKTKILSQPVGWEKAAEEEKKYEEAEEQRLMYVAATRAKDMLVISTYEEDLKDRRAWPTLDKAPAGVAELKKFISEISGTRTSPALMKREKALDSRQPFDLVEKSGEKAEREKLLVSKTELERARKEIKASVEGAGEPTYLVESVTALARKEREAPARRRDTGFGQRWGRIVHQVLEAIGSGRLAIFPEAAKEGAGPSGSDRQKLEAFIENILTSEEADFSIREGLLDHVESILDSPFWARVMKAERRYFEIPFSIRTSARELEEFGRDDIFHSASGFTKTALQSGKRGAIGQDGQKFNTWGKTGISQKSDDGEGGNLPVILSGTIDLVFWEEGKGGEPAGWVIADYKTDKIPISEASLARLGREIGVEMMDRIQAISPEFASIINFYAPQIRLYTRFWSQIVGEPVRESGLYFTSVHHWVSLIK